MTQIGTAQTTTTIAPAAFFAKWADMGTWHEWNLDTEWARLDGPFAEGSTGVLKPKGGPRTKFVITKLTDDEFIDVSKLPGARLIFAHRVETAGEHTTVTVTVTMEGPLAFLWARILGGDIAKTLQHDLDGLVEAAAGVAV
ncbi:hypothetical protein D5S18_01110 [Nocardia panacis]|uniref:Polyketide cyclase n=1 Tax=Nocardia panacis TaxID=2340916 RepID=A0A3A4KG56_9NOCA|nr:SRPBCC family protein [Nocardia panacis]RJO79899.1 hypothetical protein D5S18_01110 [Nocardia panacis]